MQPSEKNMCAHQFLRNCVKQVNISVYFVCFTLRPLFLPFGQVSALFLVPCKSWESKKCISLS